MMGALPTVRACWADATGWQRNSDNATDAVDATLTSFTLRGGLMRATDVLVVITTWQWTSSAISKQGRLYFGGTMYLSTNQTNNDMAQSYTAIQAKGATNSQIASATVQGSFAGAAAGSAPVTSAENTLADITIALKARWGANVAGEYIKLVRYFAMLLHPGGA